MPPKKRVSDSAPSPRKRARGTASQPVAIDSQLYQSQPSALSPPPPYTHTFESRLRESQPEDAIVAPAEGSEQATLAPSSEAADNAIYCHGYRVALLKDPTRVFFICHWCFKHKLTDIGIRLYNTSAAVSSAARHLSEQKLGHRLVALGKTLVASVYNALTTARQRFRFAAVDWLVANNHPISEPCVVYELSQSLSKIYISFDRWTTKGGKRGFLGIVAYYVNSDGKLRDLPIALPQLTGAYSGDRLAKVVLSILEQFSISERTLGYFVLDNASNNDTAVAAIAHELNFNPIHRRLRCGPHTINLIGQRLLWGRDADLYNNEGVDELTNEAAFIKEWRKHGPLGVLLDIINYIYTPQQYNLFKKAQRTAYQARLLYYDCVVHNAHDKAPEDHLPINLRAALLKANEYYAKLNDSPAYYAATILYPRYKHYCDQAWAEKPNWLALNNLNFQALWADYKSLPLPRPCYTRAPKKPGNIDDAIDGIIDPTRGNTEEDEYEQWKREPIVGKGTDPIQYWFGLRDQYPNLSKMALTILSIPASSCECERVFSELGDLLEPRRRCISPELLAALHSVRRWRRAGFGGGDNDDMGQSKLTDEQMDVLYELSQWVGEDDDLDTWDDG
ncbi:Dimer-Tnp-hAT dimerization containing protein [Pyrenophora tritici-repentis]|nr:Dimer-Tnp-hAT dimerization containing protein [Pyrenophora tritici-repentis]